MSRGQPTRYAKFGVEQEPIPERVQVLKRDFFYPCARCGLLYPRRKLRREQVTLLLVCNEDRDEPTVDDVRGVRLDEPYMDRLNRLRQAGDIPEDYP